MARWHRDEAWRSRQRHAAEDAKNGDKERGGSRTDTAIDECRNEWIDWVANVKITGSGRLCTPGQVY